MKKIAYLLLILLFSSCSSDEPIDNPSNNKHSPSINTQLRSVDDAIALAQQASNSLDNNSRGNHRVVDYDNINILGSSASRSTSDTLIYVVNYKDDNGFVLVSANKATEPILAFVKEGNYNNSSYNSQSGFQYFIDRAKEYVVISTDSEVSENNKRDDYIMVFKTDTLRGWPIFTERLNVKFNQYWPENIYCPNKVAGCGPIAIVQALSYFQPDMSLSLTFEGKPFDNLDVNWSEIVKHTQSLNYINPGAQTINAHYEDCDGTELAHKQLAALVRHIGVIGNCMYKESTTSMYTSDFYNLSDQLLSQRKRIYAESYEFFDTLKDGGIGLVYGSDLSVGHFWVADGVALLRYDIFTYYNYQPSTGKYDSYDKQTIETKYIHYNWGWGGVNNGYFLEDVFDTNKGTTDPRFNIRSRYSFVYGLRAHIYY